MTGTMEPGDRARESLEPAPPTETRPRLFRAGEKLTEALAADPSFTVVEAGDAAGFLLSESCFEDQQGALHLGRVNWVRIAPQGGSRKLAANEFHEVMLYRHRSGVYLARDPASGTLIPNPSRAPYHIVFIGKAAYRTLCEEIRQERLPALIEALKPLVKEMPGFRFEGARLIAPPEYARERVSDL